MMKFAKIGIFFATLLTTFTALYGCGNDPFPPSASTPALSSTSGATPLQVVDDPTQKEKLVGTWNFLCVTDFEGNELDLEDYMTQFIKQNYGNRVNTNSADFKKQLQAGVESLKASVTFLDDEKNTCVYRFYMSGEWQSEFGTYAFDGEYVSITLKDKATPVEFLLTEDDFLFTGQEGMDVFIVYGK